MQDRLDTEAGARSAVLAALEANYAALELQSRKEKVSEPATPQYAAGIAALCPAHTQVCSEWHNYDLLGPDWPRAYYIVQS